MGIKKLPGWSLEEFEFVINKQTLIEVGSKLAVVQSKHFISVLGIGLLTKRGNCI